jgi:hypothetical protein
MFLGSLVKVDATCFEREIHAAMMPGEFLSAQSRISLIDSITWGAWLYRNEVSKHRSLVLGAMTAGRDRGTEENEKILVE